MTTPSWLVKNTAYLPSISHRPRALCGLFVMSICSTCKFPHVPLGCKEFSLLKRKNRCWKWVMQKAKLNSASSSCRPHKWPGENIHRIKFSLSLSQKTQEMCSFKTICWLSSRASGVVLQKEKKTLTKCLTKGCFLLVLIYHWISLPAHGAPDGKWCISELLQICSHYLVIIQRILLHKCLDKFFWSNIIESLLNKAQKQPGHIPC